MASPTETSRSPGRAARCLIWLPAGFDAPAELLEGLRRREVALREVHDAPAVMAVLGLSRGAGPANVLVVVEPDVLRDAAALVRAVRAYHPRVGVWRYRQADRPTLEKWPEPDRALEPATHHAERSHHGNGRTPTAPTPTEPDPAASADPAAAAGRTDDDGQPLLTDEELAMLLGDDPSAEPTETDATERDGRDHFG